ncbi:Nn.00g042330.m01.CDS01 [Neocucurbitaria sp. VM-36]
MWDGLFMLLALSALMGIASFLAGILPLSFTLSSRQLRIITLLGTGVLVGTSLIVIIPEGIETMYSAGSKAHIASTRNIQPTIPSLSGSSTGVKRPAEFPAWKRSDAVDTSILSGGAIKAPVGDITGSKAPIDLQVKKTKDPKEKEKDKAEEAHPQKGGDDDSTEGHKEGHTRVHAPEDDEDGHSHRVDGHDDGPSPHAYIGVALILGYILMFLVDHLPEALSSAKPKYQPMHISLSNLARGPHNSSSLSLNGMGGVSAAATPLATPGLPPSSSSKKTPSATIGLIVHACADGIALGASSTAPSTSLSLVIFFAIMLHKAPAAFGLTSVLLKQGLSKRRARTHLAFFSLAAPVGALATWAIVHMFGRNRLGGDEGLTWTTGWVLCFSGGTFLYVAMHSMAEATSSPSHEDPTANGYMDAYPGTSGLSKSEIAIVMFGMLVPLISQIGHAHSHGH